MNRPTKKSISIYARSNEIQKLKQLCVKLDVPLSHLVNNAILLYLAVNGAGGRKGVEELSGV